MSRLTALRRALAALAIAQSLAAGPAWAEQPSSAEVSGRIAGIGIAPAPAGWKSEHPGDERLVYTIDTATGRIAICGDCEGECRSPSASLRLARGSRPGRFAGFAIAAPSAAWRAAHPADEHVVYSVDTATGQVLVCGDFEQICAVAPSPPPAAIARPEIIIVYRRADSAAITGRIYDRLAARYGAPAVFMDVYSIPLATDWRQAVAEASLNGAVILAVVGPKWQGPGPDGHARIDNDDDPVRLELEIALQAGVSVLPVLVEGATMPSAGQLPPSLATFSAINAATIDTGRDFDQDVAQLIATLDRLLGMPPDTR
ncbi:MAG: TIR domain-containing protein [Alphaproteobacteria bacterium]|nr:TIR domain-containing protein [Alphaproteobacteria bacterium]